MCAACDVTVELCVQAHASFAFLASITGTDSVPALFAKYARGLLSDVTATCDEWTKHSFDRCVFDVLIRYGAEALAGGLDHILATLRTTLDPSKPADMRLSQLALVKVLLGTATDDGDEDMGGGEAKGVEGVTMRAAMDDGLRTEAPQVIEHVLLPNMVWRVGQVAATIRCAHVPPAPGLPVSCVRMVWLSRSPGLVSTGKWPCSASTRCSAGSWCRQMRCGRCTPSCQAPSRPA